MDKHEARRHLRAWLASIRVGMEEFQPDDLEDVGDEILSANGMMDDACDSLEEALDFVEGESGPMTLREEQEPCSSV